MNKGMNTKLIVENFVEKCQVLLLYRHVRQGYLYSDTSTSNIAY
jgi:hypothetical protein